MSSLLTALAQSDSQVFEANSSQESFHSFADENVPTYLKAKYNNTKAYDQNSTDEMAPSQSDSTATGNGKIFDVDAFLSQPSNVAHLSSVLAKANNKTQQASFSKLDAVTPVELNTSSNHHVATLHALCQKKGISPIFEYNEITKYAFTGFLRIGQDSVTVDDPCRSKKEVKERLSEKGIDLVNRLDSQKKGLSPSEDGRNWVGQLQDYHQYEFGSAQSPRYTWYALGSNFACTCIIASHPSLVFGASTDAFASKKQARANAATKAVQFLISAGKLNEDGSTFAKKKAKSNTNNANNASSSSSNSNDATNSASNSNGGGVSIAAGAKTVTLSPHGQTLNVQEDASHAQKVNDICPMLGFSPPQYHLGPVSDNAPNILSGYATFPNNLYLVGAVGEVRHVFGKKDAREEVAKNVWRVLVELARSRGVEVTGH